LIVQNFVKNGIVTVQLEYEKDSIIKMDKNNDGGTYYYKYNDKKLMYSVVQCLVDNDCKNYQTFVYKYNEYGDWIRKIIFRYDKLEYIIDREIGYF
ncbi:MAG: hypothetical protein LRY27_00810, partial [Chitinophagales bacterium]|nr:hypothetical protein [Chitinophagales bacterium]